jgi:hypothetical protein
LLFHKLIVAFYLPVVIAFYDKPNETSAGVDSYIDIVFLIEIFLTFCTPYTDKNMRNITDKKSIAGNYICGWFIVDLLACAPLSILHIESQKRPRDKNDLRNIYTFNFNSLPRFYKILLTFKLVRTRKMFDYWKYSLKKTQLTLAVRNVLTMMLKFLFAILLFACAWRTVADFNKDSNANWLAADGIRGDSFET